MPANKAFNVSKLLISNRVQVPLLLGLGIGLPEVFHRVLSGYGPWFEIRHLWPEPSAIVVAICLLFCHAALRNMTVLPMASGNSLVLPTMLITFLVGIVGLYASQLHPGRYHVWTGFLVGLAWFYAIGILRARRLRPLVALIGVNQLDECLRYTRIRWQVLREPRLRGPIAAAVIDPHAELGLEWTRFVTQLVLQGVPVYHLSHLEEGLTGRVRFRSAAENDFGALLPSLTYLRLKRGIDLLFAVLLLPLILPIIGLAAVSIRIDSRGKAFFAQERIGRGGKPFICYKLRTMHVGKTGPAFTLNDDPRVTRIGKHFRKWRIDELPQIFNVLKGDMSWIGPRPEASELAERYEAHVPYYGYRHAVPPGITGWAAVHQGNVAEVDAATVKLEYDFFYIRHFSVWLDFLIVLKTFQTIWSGFGAR